MLHLSLKHPTKLGLKYEVYHIPQFLIYCMHEYNSDNKPIEVFMNSTPSTSTNLLNLKIALFQLFFLILHLNLSQVLIWK